MGLQEVKLETLRNVGLGYIAGAFDLEMSRAVRDIIDRGADGKPRRVVLEVILVPDLDEHDHPDGVHLQAKCEAKIPKQATRSYHCGIEEDDSSARLVFRDGSEDDVRQMTFSDREAGESV